MSVPILGVTLLLAASLLSAPWAAAADGAAGGPKTLAVQNRKHTQRHEFGIWAGVLPLDAFTKGITASAAYTLHFNDLFAWEVANFTYSFGVDTHLKEDLANLTQPVGPTPFETVQYYATSNAVFKPVYGKLAVLNRSLIYQEYFLVAGAGYGWLSITHRPLIDFGLGARVYTRSRLSVRMDVRDYLFFGAEDVHNEIWVSLGMSLSAGNREAAW